MRWRPRAAQQCLLGDFQPVIAVPAVQRRSRFVPKPQQAKVDLTAAELAHRAACHAQMDADTQAWLAEQAIRWEAKKKRLGL